MFIIVSTILFSNDEVTRLFMAGRTGKICIDITTIFTIKDKIIYRTRTQAHAATASVAQSVERWSRDPESRVQFPAGGGLGVAVFATGPSWVLKYISF